MKIWYYIFYFIFLKIWIFEVVSNDENSIEYDSTCDKTMFFNIGITCIQLGNWEMVE